MESSTKAEITNTVKTVLKPALPLWESSPKAVGGVHEEQINQTGTLSLNRQPSALKESLHLFHRCL